MKKIIGRIWLLEHNVSMPWETERSKVLISLNIAISRDKFFNSCNDSDNIENEDRREEIISEPSLSAL